MIVKYAILLMQYKALKFEHKILKEKYEDLRLKYIDKKGDNTYLAQKLLDLGVDKNA